MVRHPGQAETSDESDEIAPPRSRRLRRATILGVVVAMAAMWGYVLFLAFGPGRQPPIDRLEDPAFAQAAEQVCAQALERIDALPLAAEVDTAEERAAVLEEANSAYADMLDELDELTPLVAAEERASALAWLSDWRIHLGDREAFAEALRSDPTAQLLVSEKQGRHITGFIDEFARANRMVSCAEPTDV